MEMAEVSKIIFMELERLNGQFISIMSQQTLMHFILLAALTDEKYLQAEDNSSIPSAIMEVIRPFFKSHFDTTLRCFKNASRDIH